VIKKIALTIFCVLFACVLTIILLAPDLSRFRRGPIMLTRWDHDQGKITVQVGPRHPLWLRLDTVSIHTIHAIITAEDARFFLHLGIDLREIANSLAHNWREGRYARGGSTITQQVIKLLYLGNDKTLLRKMREISGALLLDFLVDKNTILEWYLNIVDFGSGVYGVSAAAQYYFATSPELLTIPQSILLASVIPSPNRWSHSLRTKGLSPQAQRRYLFILSRMRSEGFLDRRQCRIALRTGNFGAPIGVFDDTLCE
jgi:monofunctional biosynthetic peptidoglycan transglycosylase